MTVYQLEENMSSSEFIQWIAFMGIKVDEQKERDINQLLSVLTFQKMCILLCEWLRV